MIDMTTALRQAVQSATKTASNTNGHGPAVCVFCGGQGIVGWKQPRNYPLNEVQFCDCEAGQRFKAAEQRKLTEKHQAQLGATFTRAGIPAHFHGLTIDTLAELVGDDPGKAKAIEAARSMIATGYYAGKPGIYLFGEYGCGKTGVLTPVLRHFLDQGHSGLWMEFYDFTEEIQSKYGKGEEASQAMDLVRGVEWLLMDDVGDAARNNPETDDKRRLLYQIVNHRHNHVRPMLITSNLPPDRFAAQFGERTLERIIESCALVRISGRNLRRQK